MARKSIKSQAWRAFEEQVADLFRLKGFEPTSDIQVAGRQTDSILCGREEYVGSILVECKHSSGKNARKVDVVDVEDFINRVMRLRGSGDANCGYLVTNTDFTHEAKGLVFGRPEGRYVFLKTYRQLLRQTIDFTHYLAKFARDYEDQLLPTLFEPMEVVAFERDAPTRARLEQTSFGTTIIVENIEKGMLPRKPYSEMIEEFLSRDDYQAMVILGDYGTGKTSSARNHAHSMARMAMADDYVGRIPIFIPLKYFNYCGTSQAMVMKFLSDDASVPNATYEAFDLMNRSGLLLIFLDGFDEMARRVTRQVREESFKALGDLISKKSKVIITGRPSYFSQQNEFYGSADLLRNISVIDRIESSLSGARTKLPGHLISCEIAPLSDLQIGSFLRRRIKDRSSDQDHIIDDMMIRVKSIYNLKDLASRPILLEMISKSIDRIGSKDISTVSDLYDKYTSLWLDIESSKGDFRTLISPQMRVYFSIALAWQLFTTGTDGISFEAMDTLVREHFDLTEAEDVDHYSSDIQTCSFLTRDDFGVYSFAHQSFLEYFCARGLAGICMKKLRPLMPESMRDTEITLSDIEEQMPNILYFLDRIIGCNVTPSYWYDIGSAMEGRTSQLELGAGEENWSLVVQALAEGDIPVQELPDVAAQAGWALKSVVRMVERAADLGTDAQWLHAVRGLVSGGSKAVEPAAGPRRRKVLWA